MRRALYIGKFQPFHIGHLGVVRHIAAVPDIDEIVIGIGSAQWNWQNRNPERPLLDNIFTVEERRAIIERSLGGRVSKKVHIVPILDFLPKWGAVSTLQWFEYIENHVPEFHYLFTNRKAEADLFASKGYETGGHPVPYALSATLVREKMARKEIWQPLVCPEAIEIIQEAEGEKRASELFARVEIDPADYNDLCWEWRTFVRPSEADIKRILELPLFRREDICDRYLFSLVHTGANVKFRKGGLKIKRLLTRQDGVEAWASFNCDLPVANEFLTQACGEIKFPLPGGLPAFVGEEDLLAKISQDFNPYHCLISLDKKRSMHIFQEGTLRCGVDLSVFTLRGREVVTVGLEARTKQEVEAALERLGLRMYGAVNYLQFLEKFVCEEVGNDIWERL